LKKWVVLGGLIVFLATSWTACQQNAVTVPVRSLERSGKAAFFCIRNPQLDPPGVELRACAPVTTTLDALDYSVPHTIALVTQQARGEVAVLDLTAGGVIDVDPTLPGSNFLPVGALPTDIVATPASTAAFVSIGDPVRPGIFGLTSANLYLPGQAPRLPPALAAFPACSLPSVPTQVLLVSDRSGLTDQGGTPRARCPGADVSSEPPLSMDDAGTFKGVDLSGEAALFGTQKILALLPELGQIAVIDAQTLLQRPLGSFDACPIENVVNLRADLVPPGAVPADAGADGSAVSEAGVCTSTTPFAVPPPAVAPHPLAMAYADDGRLFVSDDRASVIHVVDLTDPCRPVERDSLLPTSLLEPTRAVTSTAIAVTPLLGDDKRFVYAVDLKNNGSVMVFDVSSGSSQRTPMLRPDVQSNQQEPPDRIAFSSPVVSLTFAHHELVPNTIAVNGGPVDRASRCDPTNLNDPFKPPTDFVSVGAGPHTLRGTFGFLALSDGRIAVIDIDDLDAACRRPFATDALAIGCGGRTDIVGGTPGTSGPTYPAASQESSCNVVERHRPRSNQYFSNATLAGQHAPAMQGFPLLHDKDGTALGIDPILPESQQRPKMLTPLFDPPLSSDVQAQQLMLSVTGLLPEPPDDTWWTPSESDQNSVAFDLNEPRGHISQLWTITYEGAFAKGSAARLQCADRDKTPSECERGANPSHFELYDSSVGFCSVGAQGGDLASSVGLPQGDVVEVTSDFPDPSDPYWSSVAGVCSRQACEQTYGTIDNIIGAYNTAGQAIARDFIIDRAFQDHLVLAPSPDRDSADPQLNHVPIACCFPYPVSYVIRGGQQWIVSGSTSSFAHHIVPDPSLPDPSTGACMLSCDPNLVLRNGRAVGVPQPTDPTQAGAIPGYNDPRTFRNSDFRFVVWNPAIANCSVIAGADAGSGATQPCLRRDMNFSFQEVGGFDPLVITLSASALILPESISFVPGLEQLAIPDPVSQGLMMFDLSTLRVIQTVF
jgi:hypothetical protein